MLKKYVVFTVLVIGLIMLGGCNGFQSMLNDGVATLVLYLADAPVNDVESVFVTIDKVEISNTDLGWITLNDFEDEGGEKTFDLLTLKFDEALLGQTTLQAGTYDQLRLVVAAKEDDGQGGHGANNQPGKSYILFKDGTTHDLFIPSGTTTGLKINLGGMVLAEDSVTELVLDTDVSDVMHSAGNPNKNFKFILRPTAIKVIKPISMGAISGVVTDVNGNPIIPGVDESFDVVVEVIDQNQEVVASTVASIEETTLQNGTILPAGSFLIRGVEEGSYTLQASAIDELGNIVYQMVSDNAPITIEVVANMKNVVEEPILLEPVVVAP